MEDEASDSHRRSSPGGVPEEVLEKDFRRRNRPVDSASAKPRAWTASQVRVDGKANTEVGHQIAAFPGAALATREVTGFLGLCIDISTA